jgi:copper oxidase (laccase) domain-containing protein
MTWRTETTPFSCCSWEPWARVHDGVAALPHAMLGKPLDFQLLARDASIAAVAESGVSLFAEPVRWLRQTHSTILRGIALSEKESTTLGIPPYELGAEGDGFIFRRGRASGSVAITTADCLAVIIRAGDWGALVHAGWRGLAAGIVTRAAEAVAWLAEGEAESLAGPTVGVGLEVLVMPHAAEDERGNRYEVGCEVVQAFDEAVLQGEWSGDGGAGGERRFRLAMAATARAMIEKEGVKIVQWRIAPGSTLERGAGEGGAGAWHSHRRDGSPGRNGTVVAVGCLQ